MSNVAISVEDLGKRYWIGTGPAEQYGSLRDSIMRTVQAPLQRLRRGGRVERGKRESWALRNTSFEIKHGEAVGIIGRNGAGKSTLLKVLSRITEPTTGQAVIHGRIGSLLEVGTGFHPELTGRENIYLNGAVIGMSRGDIKRHFDEIVDFADIEKYLDTPVKHYSSGMYMRLAFAVAAHLEPEVLVVDEVLAVGDMTFQRKCLDKMQDVGEQGRTVLFVSHNMPSVTRLCKRVILLDQGSVVSDGPAHQVVSVYLNTGLGTIAQREWPDATEAPGNDVVRLCAVRVHTPDGRTTESIDIRQPVGIEMTYDVLRPGYVLAPNYHCLNEEGLCLFVANDQHDVNWKDQSRPVGRYVSTAWIPGNLLAEGTVIVGAAVSTMDPVIIHFWEHDAVAFQVIDSIDGDSARGNFAGHMPGVFRPLLKWTTCYTSSG